MIEDFPAEASSETRLKRARMRAWRRGMREMDLILGGFVDSHGARLNGSELSALEALLARRDQDLYTWVSGQDGAVPRDATVGESALILDIRANWRT